MKIYIYLITTLLLLSACSGIIPEQKKEGKIYERNGVSTLLIPSDVREVYFKDSRSVERHCRAPGPDVSIQSSSGISLGASLIGRNEEISDTNGQSAITLGGRDPAVLLTRELMYRACELASNLNANQKTTLYIYNRFLKTVEKSIKMQQLVGTASASASTKSSLQNTALQNQKEPNTIVTTNTNTNTNSKTTSIDKNNDLNSYNKLSSSTNAIANTNEFNTNSASDTTSTSNVPF